jgi:hypothetical protein
MLSIEIARRSSALAPCGSATRVLKCESECNRTQQDLDIAPTQLRDYQARLGQLFQHEQYMEELAALRDRPEVSLPGPLKEGELTTAEVAERITATWAGNANEANSERVTRQRSAEEPVTARILRRAGDPEAGDSGERLHRDQVKSRPSGTKGRGSGWCFHPCIR